MSYHSPRVREEGAKMREPGNKVVLIDSLIDIRNYFYSFTSYGKKR